MLQTRTHRHSAHRRATPTLREARSIARRLTRAFAGIDAICLYGSVARGNATEWSDIDLLVTGSNPRLTPERLRRAVSGRGSGRLSLIYYPTTTFRERYANRALFIAHVKKEGIALFDRLHLLKEVLTSPFVPEVDVDDGVRTHLARLAPYTDSSRFGDNFLFCLSHLYSIGKGIVMLGIAKTGTLEFSRDAAFEAFERLNPDLRFEIKKITILRPFYHLVTGRQPEPLPFSYRDADGPMREAVTAIRLLARRAQSG